MINELHEKVLTIVLNDQTNNFEMLLAESSDIWNHHRNNQTLLTEAYKIQNKLALPVIETMLEKETIPYNLRKSQELVTKKNGTANCGLESFSNRLPQLSTVVLDE